MAQYSVRHQCGHGVTHCLYGPEAGRTRRIEWLETVDCLECAREVRSGLAADSSARAGLPPLAGSPKQIAWAEKLRADALAAGENQVALREIGLDHNFLKAARAAGVDLDEIRRRYPALAAAAQKARSGLETQTSARWWIDNRDGLRHHVRSAWEGLIPDLFSDARAAVQAWARQEKAKRDVEAAEAEALRLAKMARQREAEAAMYERIGTFRVASVQCTQDNIKAVGEDGRVAEGYVCEDTNDWVIFQVGDDTFSSLSPQAERIASDALAAWNAGRASGKNG